jgi:ferredoxin
VSRVHVDWTRCDGHGLCAELLPEVLGRDEWGFPLAHGSLEIDAALEPHAERAVRSCPLSALKLLDTGASGPVPTAQSSRNQPRT